jgi:hypothetical protein
MPSKKSGGIGGNASLLHVISKLPHILTSNNYVAGAMPKKVGVMKDD